VTSPARESARLSDFISIGVLTQTFPPDKVDWIIAQAGRKEKRSRLLPARVVVYFSLAMCLWASEPYKEVMALLVRGLRWTEQWSSSWKLPTDTAIGLARRRLGPEPLKLLFQAAVRPFAQGLAKGLYYENWHLVAIDGTTLDLADTSENEAAFGRPGNGRSDDKAAFPQARVLGLVECGTHVIFDACVGRYDESEQALAPQLFGSLKPGMLALCDRGFWSYDLWNAARQKGADLLWRTKINTNLPVMEELSDGSYLSEIRRWSDKDAPAVVVRVIEYQLDGISTETYRLVTTILDESAAPADELAGLYGERWEIESAFDELKTHQRGRQAVLRSKYPETAEAEIWSHLLVHYAVRLLMADAAVEANVDPDRTSFLNTLRIVRRQITDPASFSPSGEQTPETERHQRDHRTAQS
jgi:hypothetical protein